MLGLQLKKNNKGKINSVLTHSTSEKFWVHEKKEVEESQYLVYS